MDLQENLNNVEEAIKILTDNMEFEKVRIKELKNMARSYRKLIEKAKQLEAK